MVELTTFHTPPKAWTDSAYLEVKDVETAIKIKELLPQTIMGWSISDVHEEVELPKEVRLWVHSAGFEWVSKDYTLEEYLAP